MLSWVLLLHLVSSAVSVLNVHLVCHSHDDTGWLKTVDEYFLGQKDDIYNASVKTILDSVIPALARDSRRKFSQVEIAFFKRWWDLQSDATKETTRKLVASGQFEFVNGGWCMNDEAGPHYADIIDQMTFGHQFILDEFGVAPSTGWHIDPFGHSSTQASLFAQMGFDAWYFARIDYEDFDARKSQKELEMVWQASPSLGGKADILTGVLFHHYSPPPTFCFDVKCKDADNPPVTKINVGVRARELESFCKSQAGSYKTDNIMLTMGDDFEYMDADKWFSNLDLLVDHINANQATYGLNVSYSTPGIYTKMVHDSGVSFPTKKDDFFPYADRSAAYWTGYFTSRAALKGYVRLNSGHLQACRQLEALVTPGNKSNVLAQAMALAQHHDAIAGTSKQAVAFDYAQRLSVGNAECAAVMNDAFSALVGGTFEQCPQLNVSICAPSQDGNFTVMIYNPLGWETAAPMRLPVNTNVQVFDHTGKLVSSQMVNNSKPLPGRTGGTTMSVVFIADLPPVGYRTYTVSTTPRARAPRRNDADTFVLENDFIKLSFSPDTGLISQYVDKEAGTSIPLVQEMLYYIPNDGSMRTNGSQTSGAYIGRPIDDTPSQFTAKPELSVVSQGDVVTEVKQLYGFGASVSTRLYAGASYVEMEYTVGPLDIRNGKGQEVISRFSTSMDSGSTWFTDSNGREMIERRRFHRDTWPLTCTQPTACNYVPVNAAIYLKSSNGSQFSVMTDRTQGGASMVDGQVELMLHRRITHDDGRGVGEALNEPGITGEGLIVRAKHRFHFMSSASANARARKDEHALAFPPVVAFSPSTSKSTEHSFIKAALPANVHLLTFQQRNSTCTLVRLAHIFAIGEDPVLSKDSTVDLQSLFPSTPIKDITEMSLTANQPASNLERRLHFRTTDPATRNASYRTSLNGTAVTLKAMDIVTALITI